MFIFVDLAWLWNKVFIFGDTMFARTARIKFVI